MYFLPLIFARLLRKRRRIGILVLMLYLACYIPLGAQGRYLFCNHGVEDWRTRWCPDRLVQMGGFIRPRAEYTSLGALYWPCIAIDRLVWHPDRDPIETDSPPPG